MSETKADLLLRIEELEDQIKKNDGEIASLRERLAAAIGQRDGAISEAATAAVEVDPFANGGIVAMWSVDGDFREFTSREELDAAQHDSGDGWHATPEMAAEAAGRG